VQVSGRTDVLVLLAAAGVVVEWILSILWVLVVVVLVSSVCCGWFRLG
jgi:hypothetical protein